MKRHTIRSSFILSFLVLSSVTAKGLLEIKPVSTKNDSNQKIRFAATYLGGKGNEFCEAVAIDSDGNIYIAGNTRADNFPTTEGVFNREPMGESDVFIAKFDSDLTMLLASTRIGGSKGENAYTILFAEDNNVFVAGYTASSDFPVTPDAFDTDYNGGDGDAFILKMDKDLKILVSSTYLGGSGVESDWRSPELVQDVSGNIYIAGITGSEDFPTTAGVIGETYHGGQRDVFISKFDSDLKHLISSTFLGAGADDRLSRSLLIDTGNNELCIGGYTFSTDFPTTENAFDRNPTGGLDGFIVKLSMDLKTLYASTILKGGWIYCMMLHDNGDIYVGGHASDGLETTSGAFYEDFDKASDQGFISRLSNDLTELKSSTVIPGTYASGGGRITSLNLCQSTDGNILSAGWVRPLDFPITPGVYDETQNGNSDTYIMKMSRDLSTVITSTFIGGNRSERWNRMISDGQGNLFLSSYTLSSNFPTTVGAAFQTFSDVITDDEESLSTSPTDAIVCKIGEDLFAEKFEAFHDAAKRDDADELKNLLSKNSELLEKRDKYQRTALHSAARYGAFSAVQFLLEQGAHVNAKDESGYTPLHLASLYQNDDVVNVLLAKKADYNEINGDGQSPLILASIYGNPESVRHLLENGADVNQTNNEGNTALHIAALYRHHEKLSEMVKMDPDLNVKNSDGMTPFHLAVRRPDNEVAVKLLIGRGADCQATDHTGKNSLLLSVDRHQMGYIGLLVAKGVNINSQDDDGNTALHLIYKKAIQNKWYLQTCKNIGQVLLDEGADPHIKNNDEKSAMDLAQESGEMALIELLEGRLKR